MNSLVLRSAQSRPLAPASGRFGLSEVLLAAVDLVGRGQTAERPQVGLANDVGRRWPAGRAFGDFRFDRRGFFKLGNAVFDLLDLLVRTILLGLASGGRSSGPARARSSFEHRCHR